MGVGNGASSPRYPFGPWGLGPMGVSGGLCSTLSAVKTLRGLVGYGEMGTGTSESGEPFFWVTAAFVCFPLWPVSEVWWPVGYTIGENWECRAAVPAQTDQIPLRSSGPLPHQLNWNFRGLGRGVSSRRSLMVARAWGTADPDQLSE